jgi:hypothetical protein
LQIDFIHFPVSFYEKDQLEILDWCYAWAVVILTPGFRLWV